MIDRRRWPSATRLAGQRDGAGVVRAAVAQRVGHAADGRLVGGEVVVEGERPCDATHVGERPRRQQLRAPNTYRTVRARIFTSPQSDQFVT